MTYVVHATTEEYDVTVTVDGAANADQARRTAYRRYCQFTEDLMALFLDDMGSPLPDAWQTARVEVDDG